MPSLGLALGTSFKSGGGSSGGALSNDTSLSVFTVESYAAVDEGTTNLPNSYVGYPSASITVVATPTHPGATVGTMTFTPDPVVLGDNQLTFNVAAEDSTVQAYNVTLHVLTTGSQETAEIVCTANTASALSGTFFWLSGFDNSTVVVWFQTSEVEERTDIDFSGLSGADFVTNNAIGKYFYVYNGENLAQEVWFNTGTESAPAGTQPIQVNINIGDAGADIAAACAAQVSLYQKTVSSEGTIFRIIGTLTNTSNPYDIDSGATFTQISEYSAQSGTQPSAGQARSIMVSLLPDSTSTDVATALASALALDNDFETTVVGSGETVSVVSAYAADLTNAFDSLTLPTGFTFTTTQEGADPE